MAKHEEAFTSTFIRASLGFLLHSGKLLLSPPPANRKKSPVSPKGPSATFLSSSDRLQQKRGGRTERNPR